MLQGNQQTQEGGSNPHPRQSDEPSEVNLLHQQALVEDNLKKAEPMDALLATEEGLTSPGFGFCASSEKGGSNQQLPQQSASAFGSVNEINQNSSHLGTQRPFKSLLTPTLFMKAPQSSSSLSMRSSFQHISTSGAIPNIGELNNYASNAANSEMNAQNDVDNQRMNGSQHLAAQSNTGFTVVGTLKDSSQSAFNNKFESPPRQKSIAQRSLSFIQQHVRQSPQTIRVLMQRQQTTPPKGTNSVDYDADSNAQGSKNKENVNMSNITKMPLGQQLEEIQGTDANLKILHMQMFDSPDKRPHLKNQMSAEHESPANSCQSTQRDFANLNLSNTARSKNKYQQALESAQRISNIHSGAILGVLMGSGTSAHPDSTSNNDFLPKHMTSSPMLKGLAFGFSPKGSPFQLRMSMQRDTNTVITSLNLKMEAHAQDHDILPSQIMQKQNERSSSYLVGGAFETQRIFNPDLDEEVLHQLQSLGPTPQRPGAISKSGEKDLKARRLFHSPKESSINQYHQNNHLHQPSITDQSMISGSVPHNNLQSGSQLSSQNCFKQMSNSKAQTRLMAKTFNLEEIVEEPQRATDLIGNNNSLNCPLFSNHIHPFDNMMISNNSAQIRLNSMFEGPNSGDSGRKMKSIISAIMPTEQTSQHYPDQNYNQTDAFSAHHLQTSSIVHRLDNDFTMAENNTNHMDDNNVNPFSAYNLYNGGGSDHHFSFNNDQQQNNLPQFQYVNYNQDANQQLQKKVHQTGSHQLRNKAHHHISTNQIGISSRNLAQHHNFQHFGSTQLYESGNGMAKKNHNFSTMSFGSYQNDQLIQPIYHQCQCGANYPQQLQQQQQASIKILNAFHHNHPIGGYDGQGQRPHNHHRGSAHRHNHSSMMQNGGTGVIQRSLSMKGPHAHRSSILHPHSHRPKGIGGLNHKQVAAARQAASNELISQFDLKHSKFINTNIQMNLFIPSSNEHQQQRRSSHSSQNAEAQSKVNQNEDQQNENSNFDAPNQVTADMEGQDFSTQNQTASKNAFNKKQVSMSSSKKNTSGLKKRLYPQFLNSSNKKTTATPSTNSGLQNSTSKSNQKSNLKKRQQEINNNNQISTFDVTPQVQSQQMASADDSKFQTPKGPSLYHHHQHHSLKGGASNSSGLVQAMSFSTPDDDKDVHLMGESSTQKTQQAVFQHSIANHQRHQLILGQTSNPNANDSQHDSKMHIMESGDKNNQPAPPRPTCNCKRSKCLKLYCDCFTLGLGCGPECNCQDCCNVIGNEERKGAIESILERNPNAFKPKILEDTGIHSKGCHCKKSGCLKKYCECYQSGVLCTDKCVCDGCQNCNEHSKIPQVNNFAATLKNIREPIEEQNDQMMVDDFNQVIVNFNQHPEEVKQQMKSEPRNQDHLNFDMQKHRSTSNFKNESSSAQDEDLSAKKSKANRSIAHDLEKLLLSEDKQMTTPDSGAILDNIEAKYSARKRRATDQNTLQIINQHELQQPNYQSLTPISKKTKQQTQSSAKAANKNLVNRVILDQMVSDSPPPSNLITMSLSNKKNPPKMIETKKTPIKITQNLQVSYQKPQEDAAAVSAAKQIEHMTPPPSQKQINTTQPVAQPSTNISNPMVSSVTTRSKRKQLEASTTSLSEQKPQQRMI